MSDRALAFVTSFVGGSGQKGSGVDEGCSDPPSTLGGSVDVGKSEGPIWRAA